MRISKQFINLRVRTKLYLFLVIPLITMLALIGSAISDKYSVKADGDQVYQFTTVVFELADLIHSLQQERGLSVGLIGSAGKRYRDELKIQRLISDERLAQLHDRLTGFDPSRIHPGMADEFAQLMTQLERLPGVRSEIDDSHRHHFRYYSNINTIAINIANYLQAKYDDSHLSQQGALFTLLLEIQEYSGQERGLLHHTLSQQQLNLHQFQDIAVSIALQQRAIEHYLFKADIHYRTLLERELSQPIEARIKALRAAAFNKWRRNELLNEMHSLIGYGGLIHDFKNYVIRGRPFYYDRFTRMFADARQILVRFRQIDGLGKQELGHIDTIEKTFKRYRTLLDTVKKMRDEGTTVIAIDKVVKVDDTPALSAITALRKNITTVNTHLWWQSATTRIEGFKKINDELRSDILQDIARCRQEAEQALYLYIALMVFVLITTLLLAYLLINRLANETSLIASSMNDMHKSGAFGTLSIRESDDEIGEIVRAFNTLVEKRDQAEAQRLQSQQQLLEAQKMNSLYKLSGGVAHNFNNMLATILGYASLAMNHKDVERSEKVKGYLNYICDNVERASTLVTKIVTYSQADHQTREEPIQIGEMVEGLIRHQQRQLSPTIQLIYHIEEALPPVRVDQEQFKRTFDALFLNAVEAIETEGVIEITLQIVTLTKEQCSTCDAQLDGRFIELSFEDSGRGIAADNIKHIFEPFFTTKGLSEGAGMGLAMVYGFIRNSGGHTMVTSTLGQGSKFKLILPIEPISEEHV